MNWACILPFCLALLSTKNGQINHEITRIMYTQWLSAGPKPLAAHDRTAGCKLWLVLLSLLAKDRTRYTRAEGLEVWSKGKEGGRR